ncbi:MAG: leucyl aminopeptidase [Acidobacteriota bacterium]|nr:leucyl aminopeptidase [Acidobacteriota bacterium]
MNIKLEHASPQTLHTETLILIEFEQAPRPHFVPDLYASGEIKGKTLEMTLLHQAPGFAAKRVLLVGAGQPDQFNPQDLRKLAGAAVRHLKEKSIRNVALGVEKAHATPEFVSAAIEGALLGNFDPDCLKSDKSDSKQIESFTISVEGDVAGLDAAVSRGRVLAESQNFARDLANAPPNLLNPSVLAERARQMASEEGLECEILDQDRMKQLGMGALLAVAMGSAEAPATIVLRYKPAEGARDSVHLGLIGKGVTFDTGGISIKPADGMEKMKYDMAGGAAVIGAMRAIAQLKPRIPVTALIPAVENMCGSRAQRPGDIVTTLSGKTVEVLNTDAEGRMILADALTYAKMLGCTHLVDAATLTGAIVVALGTVNAGVFANNEELQERWLKASKGEGEKMWAMPMDAEYKEQLKNVYADLQNIGTRQGGAITAAMFLKEFADPTPWVHLDIAGIAWLDDAKPYMAKGPTGAPMRSFVNLAMNW